MWQGNVSVREDGNDLNIEVKNDDVKGETLCVMTFTDMNTNEVVRNTVSLDDCIEILRGSRERVRELTYLPYRKGFFPETIREAYMADEGNYICSFTIPESRHATYYSLGGKTRIYKSVPYPELLFLLEAREGRFVEQRVFCLKPTNSKNGGGRRRLYQFPLGNVSNVGSICMGNISTDAKEGVEDFVFNFFSGVRNDDYWEKGNHIKDAKLSQAEFLSSIDGKEFPYKLLLPAMGTRGFETASDVDSYVAEYAKRVDRVYI